MPNNPYLLDDPYSAENPYLLDDPSSAANPYLLDDPYSSAVEPVGAVKHVVGQVGQGAGSMLANQVRAIGLEIDGPDQDLLEGFQTLYSGKTPVADRYELNVKNSREPGKYGFFPEKNPLLEPFDWYKSLKFTSASDEEKESMLHDMEGKQREAINAGIYKAGESFDAMIRENAWNNPELQSAEGMKGFWLNDVPQGVGSMIPFVLEAVATRGALSKVAPTIATQGATLTVAGSGAYANEGAEFVQALEGGSTLQEAFETRRGAKLIGSSEAIPIFGWLEKADKASGGSVKAALKRVLLQGSEEAVQEFSAEMANALHREAVYNPDTGVWETITEGGKGGAVGFTTGALLQTITEMIVPGRSRGPKPSSPIDQDKHAVESILNAESIEEVIKNAESQAEEIDISRAPLPDEIVEDIDYYETPLPGQENIDLDQTPLPGADEINLEATPLPGQPVEEITLDRLPGRNLTADVPLLEMTEITPEEIRSQEAKERDQKQRQVNPAKDDILSATAKRGGLSWSEAEAQGIDPADRNKRSGGLFPVFTKKGKTFDEMAEALAQDGYVSENYTANEVLDKVSRALGGEKILTPEGVERQAEIDHYDQLSEQELNPSPEELSLAEVAGSAVGRGIPIDDVEALAVKAPDLESLKRELDNYEIQSSPTTTPNQRSPKEEPEGFDIADFSDTEIDQLFSGQDANEIIASRETIKNIDEEAHKAATSPENNLLEPTQAQKEAGNYKKGHTSFQGLDVAIENPEGSKRSGTDPDGNSWEVEMKHHNGYLKRTEGADGDQVDAFIGPKLESEKVFVVDQINKDGSFDEHKVLLGFNNKVNAIGGYKANYQKGFKVGPITEMSIDEFKGWLRDGDNTKPLKLKAADKPVKTKQKKTPPKKPEDVTAEIQSLGDTINQRYKDFNEKQPSTAASTAAPSESDFSTPEEKQRMHDLKMDLPSRGQEISDAKKRIQERIKDRKKKPAEAPKEKIPDWPEIVSQPKARYIKKLAKKDGLKKGSPGYDDAVSKLEEQYEEDYDKALAALSFEQYNELNKETPESLNRQAHEGLQAELEEEGLLDDDSDIKLSQQLGFYSGLSKAFDSIKQDSGSADQLLNTIKKQPGVKAEELEWTGLEDYLNAKKESGEKVTKQELQDFVVANGVQVEEVVNVFEPDVPLDQMYQPAIEAYAEDQGLFFDDRGEGGYSYILDKETNETLYEGSYEDIVSSAQIEGDFDQGQESGTKFQDYQLPGGENYREVLLKLPQKDELKLKHRMEVQQQESGMWNIRDGNDWVFRDGYSTRQELESIASQDPMLATLQSEDFKGQHFDEPNILAHVRLNDRTDSDGNKVLFVEEVQSDYGQQARKEGIEQKYQPEDVTPLPENDPAANQPDIFWYFNVPGNILQIPKGKYKTEAEAKDYIVREKIAKLGVPDAPFIRTTNAWTELAVKRILRIAAEEGYNSVSWTTGQQQADRYNLSKKLDRVTWYEDTKKLVAYDKSTKEKIIDQTLDSESQIEDYIGKELAARIASSDYDSADTPLTKSVQDVLGKAKTLSGKGLVVGGEGMKGFYDRTLPNIVKKVARKLDKKTIVSTINIEGVGEVFNVEISDKAKDSALAGQSLFRTGQGRGIPVADVQSVVDSFLKKYKGADDGLKVIVHQNQKAYIEATGKDPKKYGRIAGEYIPRENTAHLVAGNLGSIKQAAHTLQHEIIVHKGLGFFPLDARVKLVESIAENAPQSKALKDLWSSVERDYKGASDYIKAEELLARLSERDLTTTDKYFNKIMNFFRAIFEKFGFSEKGLSKEDLVGEVYRFAEAFESGKKAGLRAPMEARMAQEHLSQAKEFDPVPDTRKETFIRKIQDRHRVLKKTIETIEKSDGNITEVNNAYLAEERFHGKTEEDLASLEQEHVDPIIEKMTSAGISQNEIDLYLIARHAEERNEHIATVNESKPDGGSGMLTADANKILDAVAKDERFNDFKTVASMVDEMLRLRRSRQAESGLMSQEDIDQQEESYKFYVPLKGFADDTGKEGSLQTGKGFAIKGKESFRAMGRSSLPASPLMHSVSDTSTAIVRARKNEVGQHLKRLIEDNPNPSYWGVFSAENPDTERGFNSKGEVVPDMPVQMWNFTDKLHPNGSLYLPVKEGGKVHYLKITDERMSKALANLDADANNQLLRASGTAVRFLSTMSTSWNPEFVATNFTRDIQTAVYNILAEESLTDGKVKGKKLAKQMVKDAPKAIRAIYRHNRDKAATNEFGEKYYKEFLADGAKTGFFDSKSLKQQQKSINNMISMAKGGIKGNSLRWRKNLIDYIEHSNSAVENGVRLSAYVHARKNGATRIQASSLAKNLTVNFNRRGELGPTLSSLYMFANASIQGSATFLRSMATLATDEKGKRKLNTGQKAAVGLATTGYLLSHMARFLGGEDEDGEDWIDKVPAYERERNIIIFNPFGEPGERFNIPLPYGYNVFYNMGDSFESLLHSDSEARKPSNLGTELVLSAMGSFMPISFQTSQDADKAVIKTVTPTVLQPVVQLAVNENYYGGRIYKEQQSYEAKKADSHLSMRSTKGWYKDLAEMMNKATGGSEYKSGVVDLSPDSIEHLMEFTFGGLYRTTDRTAETVRGLITGEEVDTRNKPFVRSFYKEPNASQDQSTFYDQLDQIKSVHAEMGSLRGRERIDFINENKGVIRLKKRSEVNAKELSSLRKRLRAVEDRNINPEIKAKQMERIEKRMKAIIDKFNKSWNEAN